MPHDHIYDTTLMLEHASARHGIDLCTLVAETALWASPEVAQWLRAETGTLCYFPWTRRLRAKQGERRGAVVNGIRLDDNTYANHAIKQALGVGRNGARGFEACHVWPASCYSADCHTAIPNLVLLPRSLASLSDYNPRIQAALQYRSFRLYGWHPDGVAEPAQPQDYPDCWRDPLPFTEYIVRAMRNRRAKR